MGRLPTGERKYAIQQVWDVHREIARLLVIGMKHVDIAEQLGISEATVSYTANSPVVKREIDLMRGARDLDAVDVAKRIQEVAPKALEVLEELLDTANDAIKYRTAADILDRAGHAAVRNVRLETLSVHLNKEDIEDIRNRARGIGLLVDQPIEAIE
jgi:predicted transcriptional regulator